MPRDTNLHTAPRQARFGLSAKLLVMTIVFVMLAEVLIFTPSIARFRLTYLEEVLAAAHLAGLSVEAAPQGMVTDALQMELLDHVGAYFIDVRAPGKDVYLLGEGPLPEVDLTIHTNEMNPVYLILQAYESLFQSEKRVIRVYGVSPRDPNIGVTVVMDESPLHEALEGFAWRILALSIFISLITAGLVFLSLRWLIVRPLIRFSDSLMRFRDNPGDESTTIRPSGRRDELGLAEVELYDMQRTVRGALKQRERLAALGTAVTKVNHDLRNMLSTASLMSEALQLIDEPTVQKTVPHLIHSIDRAADLCAQTLHYTSGGGPPLQRSSVELRSLVTDVAADVAPWLGESATLVNAVPERLTALIDREQIRRVLTNIAKNALEVGADRVEISASRVDNGLCLWVSDTGPGLPPRAREHLFQPFAGSARPGGTGLGLAIAREIAQAHGGDLALDATGADGTRFRLSLPI